MLARRANAIPVSSRVLPEGHLVPNRLHQWNESAERSTLDEILEALNSVQSGDSNKFGRRSAAALS